MFSVICYRDLGNDNNRDEFTNTCNGKCFYLLGYLLLLFDPSIYAAFVSHQNCGATGESHRQNSGLIYFD